MCWCGHLRLYYCWAKLKTMSSATENTSVSTEVAMPSALVLQYAAQKAEETDRPIMLDYWRDSLSQKVMLGIRSEGEKLLVKNASEYTSQIVRLFKVENCYLVLTENSLYIVSAGIQSCTISD